MSRETIYKHYLPENKPNYEDDDKAYWFIFHSSNLLINTVSSSIPFVRDLKELNLTPLRKIYLGTLKKHPCYTVEVENDTSLNNLDFKDLRSLYSILDEDLFLLAGRAIQIINWDKNHSFCGKCGAKTVTLDHEMAKHCPECGFTNFTRLSPAVITAIVYEGKLLMAQHSYGYKNRYGLIAGFVEAGETLEEAVQREILEEVGLKVKNIEYFGSQPWPFPHSLMIGFTAEYESGDIEVDGKEIEHARWFTKKEIPDMPSKISIASELIDWFCENNQD
ncbi:NAD(+) diphosphatase [Methanobacterium alcaliphilum]|uniref:NAD(+) diphosphatase n=1 Tax=Methanobacterium alcaliphilum TaxID=392018 RepID=UPI00200A4C04|nr:NAD(+) diphosphatase [Methanobacterium alcaliphilum]MCK9150701.1 NAD(+) diphosphatase [Methanobacterium alcaliphilum]